MKGLITAGGRGTRMRPLTFSSNKHFIPLANKPLLFYAIEELVEVGIKEIGVNYNPGQLEEIKAHLGTGRRWGVKFTYILQEKPLGLAHIIKVAESFLGKSRFVMHLGDNIFYGGIKPLVDRFHRSRANALLVMLHHEENWRLGVPYFDRKKRLKKIVEKPKSPPHDWAIPGLYFFDHHVFECFRGKDAIKPSARGELEIGSTYNWLVKHGYEVEAEEFKGVWKDPGKFDDWLDTNQFLLDQTLEPEWASKVDDDVRIEGRVKIGKNCRIKGSLLRGPVVIGDGVVIEDSFIGPYSSIGNNCRVVEAKIENSVIMERVCIDSPKKPLDSCLVGEGSLIKGNSRPLDTIELFLGNQCILKL
jgi:glucose-1-phosphate thymidylyltransferase